MLASCGLIIWGLMNNLKQNLEQRILTQAKITAAALDPKQLAKLTGNEQDPNKASCLQLKKQLHEPCLATRDCHSPYLIGQKTNGKVFFHVHSRPLPSKEYASSYLINQDIDPSYLPALNGKTVTAGLTTGHWGTFMTALVPISDPQDRHVLAVLGMNITLEHWKATILRQLLAPSTAILLFGLLLTFLLTDRQRLKKIVLEQTQKLKKSSEELQTILYSIGDGVIVTDAESKIIEINPTAEKLTGWTQKEAQGRPLHEIFQIKNTSDHASCNSPVQTVVTTSQRLERASDVSLLSKDGQEHQIAYSAAPIIPPQGTTWGLVLNFRDISEEQNKQKQLAELAEKYQNIFENAPIGIIHYDSKGNLTECNPFFAFGIGTKREELTGLNMLTQLKDQKLIHEIRMSLTEGQGYYEDLYTSVSKGKMSYVRGFFKGIRNKGEITGGIGILEDITERKLTENKLHKTQDLLQKIIDSMPQIMICVDPKGKIMLFNRQAEQEYDLKAGQAINQPFVQALPSLRNRWPKIQESIETKQIRYQNKVQLDQKQGRYFDVTIYPLVGTDHPGAVLLIEDISKQVQLEELMIQSEKMLSVGGLAAGMAHEINNPLAGIIQSAEILHRRLTEDLPGNIQAAQKAGLSLKALRAYLLERKLIKMLDNIQDSGFRAAGIIKNMLSFARKEGPEFTNHSIKQLLDQTVELASTDYDLKKQFDFKQIKIIREYDPDLPQVACAGSKIQQVFFNILKNGAEAMHESKKNTGQPEQPCFWLRIYALEQEICIEIKDNGPGMDEEIRKRIFEPFFTTKQVGQGTGLGLSVSYFIITVNHQGKLSVESQPGKGCKFIINLPITRH